MAKQSRAEPLRPSGLGLEKLVSDSEQAQQLINTRGPHDGFFTLGRGWVTASDAHPTKYKPTKPSVTSQCDVIESAEGVVGWYSTRERNRRE